MSTTRRILPIAIAVLAIALAATAAFAQTNNTRQARRGRNPEPERGVYKARVVPHWFADNSKFWYRNELRGGASEFILVDAEQGTRQSAFNQGKLAASLSKAMGKECKAEHLPFTSIEFSKDGKSISFEAGDKSWRCDLDSYQCSPAPTSEKSASLAPDSTKTIALADETDLSPFDEGMNSSAPDDQDDDQDNSQQPGQARRGKSGSLSPDGKWAAAVRDHNIYLKALPDGAEEQITQDGKEGDSYARLRWSPDSKILTAWQIVPGDQKLVYLIQSSPTGGGRAKERSRPYGQAGDKFTTYRLALFDVTNHKLIKPDVEPFEHEYETPLLHWSLDGSHVTWQEEDRGHQRMRLVEAGVHTGSVRNLVDERTKTFVWTAHTEGPARYGFRIFTYLDKTDEILHQSEKDGWRHIYLVHPETGESTQITKGPWVFRGISSVDEDKRQIWFAASGMYVDQDPYFIHYGRVNFDGTGLVMLTEGNGNHTIAYSPDRRYIIDTYSRVDAPPVNELRRVSDGKLVCKLEVADIAELVDQGFKPPEVFSAKGRDGVTDIWGVIYRPANFDPNKKYPVLENIYNGPQDSYVPKSFSGSGRRGAAYGQLGFIVVQCDGMGTANRSKAFHDVCWHNLADGGFPDRIAWIKAAGAKHPEMDLTRVGIFGTSAGGQNAAAAVIFHSDFYKAAVANSGCHDNRLDKASWNEQWMGYMSPDKIWSKDDDNWYSKCSNIDNADKLGAKLFLIVGEMDDNVPPESTIRLVDALIKAGKDFDFLEVPGANHGAGSRVTQRRTQDFFVQNLLGRFPPNRNAGESDDVAN